MDAAPADARGEETGGEARTEEDGAAEDGRGCRMSMENGEWRVRVREERG